jgi:hypothetical protein
MFGVCVVVFHLALPFQADRSGQRVKIGDTSGGRARPLGKFARCPAQQYKLGDLGRRIARQRPKRADPFDVVAPQKPDRQVGSGDPAGAAPRAGSLSPRNADSTLDAWRRPTSVKTRRFNAVERCGATLCTSFAPRSGCSIETAYLRSCGIRRIGSVRLVRKRPDVV